MCDISKVAYYFTQSLKSDSMWSIPLVSNGNMDRFHFFCETHFIGSHWGLKLICKYTTNILSLWGESNKYWVSWLVFWNNNIFKIILNIYCIFLTVHFWLGIWSLRQTNCIWCFNILFFWEFYQLFKSSFWENCIFVS